MPAARSRPPMLRRARALLGASHLEPSLAVTLATTALALGVGLGARALVLAVAVLAGQLSIGWSNDWWDRDDDRAGQRSDKPVAAGAITPRAVLTAAVIALVVCAVASLLLGLAAAAAHLVHVASGWVYNLVLKRTRWSIAPWAVGFGVLPAVATLAEPVKLWPAWWMVLAGAALGAGAHLANTLPDLERDRQVGVTGLPHRLGRTRSTWWTVALLAAGIALVASGVGAIPGLAIGALGVSGLAVVVTAIRRGADTTAFRAVAALLLLLAIGVVGSGTTLT